MDAVDTALTKAVSWTLFVKCFKPTSTLSASARRWTAKLRYPLIGRYRQKLMNKRDMS